ncbi:MAG TPA: hypothetical protein ENJ18_13195 [Nannocystis exedens]|nr:hypothetical protein [Nannocystis exedens]
MMHRIKFPLYALTLTLLGPSACGDDIKTIGDIESQEGSAAQCSIVLPEDTVAVSAEVSGDDFYYHVCSGGELTYTGDVSDIVVDDGGLATVNGDSINIFIRAGASVTFTGNTGNVYYEDGAEAIFEGGIGNIYHCESLNVDASAAPPC